MERTIELKELSIGYKIGGGANQIVANGVDASICSGELTSLLGANGVGKSTLLKTMTAVLTPLNGEVLYCGKALSEYSHKELSKMISIVLTERVTIKNITVFELVSFGRTPYTGFWGNVSKIDRDIVAESLRLVGIEHLAERTVQTLSDGERQKAMIAKALAQQTPIILLDEPTAFLDFPSKVEIMQLLHRLSRQTGKTIFMSTHDLDLALQISDKIWLMDRERGIHTGIPEDLALDGSLRSFFDRKGILFDPHTGLFRVGNDVAFEVRIVAQGYTPQIEAMVRKALMRNGIVALEESAEAKYEVRIAESGAISVVGLADSSANGVVDCKNVEALLKVVAQ